MMRGGRETAFEKGVGGLPQTLDALVWAHIPHSVVDCRGSKVNLVQAATYGDSAAKEYRVLAVWEEMLVVQVGEDYCPRDQRCDDHDSREMLFSRTASHTHPR